MNEWMFVISRGAPHAAMILVENFLYNPTKAPRDRNLDTIHQSEEQTRLGMYGAFDSILEDPIRPMHFQSIERSHRADSIPEPHQNQVAAFLEMYTHVVLFRSKRNDLAPLRFEDRAQR